MCLTGLFSGVWYRQSLFKNVIHTCLSLVFSQSYGRASLLINAHYSHVTFQSPRPLEEQVPIFEHISLDKRIFRLFLDVGLSWELDFIRFSRVFLGVWWCRTFRIKHITQDKLFFAFSRAFGRAIVLIWAHYFRNISSK